ncbi:hypothetical protein [Streptomyces macrosporus]|uniref:Uncharacterized protein n=1 Tax=Streptomyces macrosporus TaxID=44032 RepID=A0ABP5WQU1_9ACTN
MTASHEIRLASRPVGEPLSENLGLGVPGGADTGKTPARPEVER